VARLIPPVATAVAFMALSALVQVLDSVIVRVLAEELHPFEILFLRNLFSLLVLAPFLAPSERTLKGKDLWLAHGSRAVLKLAAMASAFFAISLLPLSVFTAIAFTTPFFATLGAILFLGEPIRITRLAALCLGFAGILVVLRPDSVPVGMGALLALVSAVGFAAVVLVLKFTSGRDSASRIVWLNLVISAPLGLAMSIAVWSTPSPTQLGLMFLQGVGGLAAQLAVTSAMSRADASLLIAVDFVRLPLAVGLGFALFGEPVEVTVLGGGAIIFCSLVLLFSREGRRPRR
jgi:drug/metabolite transporter (DMT)-like permease